MLLRDKRRPTIGRYGYKRKVHRLRNNEPFMLTFIQNKLNHLGFFLNFSAILIKSKLASKITDASHLMTP